MTFDLSQHITDTVDQFYNSLNIEGLNPRLNQPKAGLVLAAVIAAQPTVGERVDVCWAVWQRMQPDTEHMQPLGDKGLHYTKRFLSDILRPYAHDLLLEGHVERFEQLRDFWNIEGFQAAIAFEQWSTAAHILHNTMRVKKVGRLSDHRDRQLREALHHAMGQLGHPPQRISLYEQWELVEQDLQNRMTKNALTQVVGEAPAASHSTRKM